MPPASISRRRARVATEVVAALLWPVQLLLTVFLPVLPVVAVVVADLERSRARECGSDIEAYHVAVGSWPAWIRRRLHTGGMWRRDVPVSLASLVLGVVSCVTGILGFVGGVVMLLAPVFWLTGGVAVSVGPWTSNSLLGAWLMVPGGVVLILLAVWVLVLVSLGRDAALRVLSGDEEERLKTELGTVRTSRASLLEAFEAERRRIERDLHDGAQQELLALSITLGMLEHAAEGTGPDGERVRELARRAHDQADRSLVRLRETVHGIHPRELTDHGLFAALGELVARTPLDVTWECSGDDAVVPSSVAGAMYFVVAESLTNVAVHADVERGRVQAAVGEGVVRVTVSDAGRGGAVMQDGAEGGTGLAGLRERVRALGGELVVDSEPGAGTTVTATAPLTRHW